MTNDQTPLVGEPTPVDDRGRLLYGGRAIPTKYGHFLRVQNTDPAEGPGVWLFGSYNDLDYKPDPNLNLAQAVALHAVLGQFIDSVPARWKDGDRLLAEARRQALGAVDDPVPDGAPVAGYCPMGCGQTLTRRAHDGAILCGNPGCARPDAVDTIVGEQETEHIVQFDPVGFTIRHPLRERLDDDLMQCELHRYCSRLDGPPRDGTGRYQATTVGPGSWTFLKISEPTS